MTKKEKKEFEERKIFEEREKRRKLYDICYGHHWGPILISSELSSLYFHYTTYKGEDLLLSSFSFVSEKQCNKKLCSLSFEDLYKYTKEIQATACNDMIVEHCPKICLIRPKILEELQYLYDQYLEKKESLSKKDETLKVIAKIHWLHAQATLHIRGGGWIPETLACILMISADIHFSRWNTESWSEIMTNTLEEFVEKYPSLFEIS